MKKYLFVFVILNLIGSNAYSQKLYYQVGVDHITPFNPAYSNEHQGIGVDLLSFGYGNLSLTVADFSKSYRALLAVSYKIQLFKESSYRLKTYIGGTVGMCGEDAESLMLGPFVDLQYYIGRKTAIYTTYNLDYSNLLLNRFSIGLRFDFYSFNTKE